MTNPQEYDVNSPLWKQRRDQLYDRMIQRLNEGTPYTLEDFQEGLRICGAPEWVIREARFTRDEHGATGFRCPVWEPGQTEPTTEAEET